MPTSYGKPLYLHSLEQDGIYIWSKDGKRITRSGAPLEDGEQEGAAQTRGALKNNILDYGSFGVTAIYKEENQNKSLFLQDGDPKIAVATPFIHNKFWDIEDALWPKQGEVSFHAFAPYTTDANSPLTFTQDIAAGKTQITYTASNTDIANQPDLIVATNKGQKSKEALGLNFCHALTAVTFAVDKNLADVIGKGKQLTKVELRGIRNQGTCDLSLSGTANVPSAQWSLKDDKVTYTFDVTDKNIIVGQDDYALTLGDQTLMMIPQRLDTDAELIVTLVANGKTEEIKSSLYGEEWTNGKSVIYKLSTLRYSKLDIDMVEYDNSWNRFDRNPYIQENQGHYRNYWKEGWNPFDRIGLYVVNSQNELVVDNLCLVKGLQSYEGFIPENGKNFVRSSNRCKYFLYYPYSNDKQNVNVLAETAEDFFKEKIENQEISTFQRDGGPDLQVGKATFNQVGRMNVKMQHQVGLVVLHMPSSQNGTIRFKNDSWKYYYGEKRARPKEIDDYDILAGVGGNADAHYYPSRKFVGNYPYINQRVDYSSRQGWYRCAFIVPFGKTVKFKAEDKSEDYRSSNFWGYLQDISASTSRANPIVKIDIECDVPGVKIAREYYGSSAKVEQFDIPEVTDYEFECWGSNGQSKNGGKVSFGGYAGGSWTASENNKQLYICCGNQNGFNNGRSKGLNCDAGVWGGGGTHIATSKIKTGETYEYVNDRDRLLIVAGGSGGSGASGLQSGAGGGEIGQKGQGAAFNIGQSTGGTQTGPGSNSTYDAQTQLQPSFGVGGYKATNNQGAQGGGGYFGGGGTTFTTAGSGGSGYVNNPALKNGLTIDGKKLEENYKRSTYFHPYSYESAVLGLCRITWTYHRPATLK